MTNVLIYIVDDDLPSAEFIMLILKKHHIGNCQIYTDPEEFLSSEKNIDICILDYRFSNSSMDGLQITEELIKRNELCRIIIVTVAPDLKRFMKVHNAGAWKYLDKSDPDFNSDLVKYVKRGIELVTKEQDFLDRHKLN